MGMLFLIWKELGMVNFPIHGLAVIVKKSFPIRGFAAHGEIFFPVWVAKQKNFPMNGLAGIVKENFPMSSEAANGETFFYYDC